jgi:hypothetical protein
VVSDGIQVHVLMLRVIPGVVELLLVEVNGDILPPFKDSKEVPASSSWSFAFE